MPSPSSSTSDASEPDRVARPAPDRARRMRGLVPVALAAVVTLALGGASVARAVTAAPLDAHADLQFSLDGATWTDAPGLVLGSWGCDLSGTPAVPDPDDAIGGSGDVDPCSMSPGESIDRTYHVRNATGTGRTGRFAVGVGDYVVSDNAEFHVSSTISGPRVDADTVLLVGPSSPGPDASAEPGTTVAVLDLAPGQSARVVDEVSVPLNSDAATQRQSVSPMMWVSFSDLGLVDTDGDGLPDVVEEELGTDPADAVNVLPDGTVGSPYGPEPFLPTPPSGTALDADTSTLPAGVRLEDGVLVGTPIRAGTDDIAFTVTMPGGATYSSVRRVVIRPRGGGSVELPDPFWPIVIIGIIGGGIGSVGNAIGGSLGSSLRDSDSGSIPGVAPATPQPSQTHPAPSTPSSSVLPTPSPSPGAGQIPVGVVSPPEGAPPSEWARANSQVRGSLPTTGVGVADLLLWALTAAAAGATLVLLGSRRRDN